MLRWRGADGGDRAFFAHRREAEKQAAIDAKVETLRLQKETEEANRELTLLERLRSARMHYPSSHPMPILATRRVNLALARA